METRRLFSSRVPQIYLQGAIKRRFYRPLFAVKWFFCLMLAMVSSIVPSGCISAINNNLTTTSEKGDLLPQHALPPDADLRLNPDDGTVQYLKGKNLSLELDSVQLKSENPADIAISFVEFYRTIFKLAQPHDELRCLAVQTDELGLKHVRFQQIYQAIPVWGKELNVHLNRQNSVYLVQGRYIPTPRHVHTRPAINGFKAAERVLMEIRAEKKESVRGSAELVIYAKPSRTALLAHKVPVPGWVYFVDAVKGEIVDRIATRQP